MRILVEPSDYNQLRNLGDVAMQQTAVCRIAKFWPTADIQVLTDRPDALARYAPNVRGITAMGRHDWMWGFLPRERVPGAFLQWERQIRRTYPRFGEAVMSLKLKLRSASRAAALASFLDTIRATDLLVVCGMGGVTDVFERYALDLLDTIGLVKANGKGVVAMFGQAFGPISSDTEVAERAREVLPQVDFIGLRESRASIPLLERLGVNLSRVMVTGDDALQIAAQNRCSKFGDSIGINVRVASYSQVTLTQVQQLGEVLRSFASARSVPLQPLPILHLEGADIDFIQLVAEGYSRVHSNLSDSPDSFNFIKQVHNCRIVVVGSYHAAVFALAQGVPIIGLHNSDYYRDKFLGLKALFEIGVSAVDLSEPEWATNLSRELVSVWESAPAFRPRLIEMVDRQIELSLKAYERVRELVERRCAA
jgi:polysaccharide pyruvyl transferase WcaK-like protein